MEPEDETQEAQPKKSPVITIEEYETKYKARYQFPIENTLVETLDFSKIANSYILHNPLWFDHATLWWSWSHTKKIYEMIDETDLMIMIDRACNRSFLNAGIKSRILEAYRREARKTQPTNPPKTWVQFGSQIYDTKTGEQIEPSGDYFVTNRIPWKCAHHSETPTIDKLLKQWSPDNHHLLKQILAYCCLADYPIQRIFLLIGGGSNGKSTYLRLLRKFIGNENVASTQLDLLVSNHFQTSKLHKKLACIMGETNFSALKNTNILKNLSGGDVIAYEFKNKGGFDDINYAKIIIATNSLPVTHDKTDGFYRRWLIIDFNQRFTEKIDPLETIPEEEYNALAAWCLNELTDLIKKREFLNEVTIEERRKRYEQKANPLNSFIGNYYEKNLNSYVPSSEFFDSFCNHLQANGHRILTYQVVRAMLKDEGYDYDKKRLPHFDNPVSVIVGLKRKEVFVPDVPVVPLTPIRSYEYIHRIERLEQPERVEQTKPDNTLDLASHWLKENPLNNAFDFEEKFGMPQVELWLKNGVIMENPFGTYRIV